MVQELFPAFVAVVAEVDVDQGVVARSGGLFDQTHAGKPGGFAALFYVAGRAGADDVFPGCFSALYAQPMAV